MTLRFVLPFSIAALFSVSASASPICSNVIGEFSCVYEGQASTESLVLCTNDVVEEPILIVGNALAHGVQPFAEANGTMRYESDLVRLVVSNRGGTAIFVDKELSQSAQCKARL